MFKGRFHTEGKKLAKVGCIVAVACLVAFGFLSDARGEDWILYEMDENYVLYYDKESVSMSDKGIVKVRTTTIYCEREVDDRIKQKEKKEVSSERDKPVTATKERWEVDCVNSQHRLAAYAEYGNDGQVIRCEQNDVMEWVYMMPGSAIESLAKILCIKPKTKEDAPEKKIKEVIESAAAPPCSR